MTYSNNKTYTLLSAYDLSGGDTGSDPVRVGNLESGIVQIAQSAVTGTTKTIASKVQGSIDGTTWFDVASATVTSADAAASVDYISLTSINYPWLRVYSDAHADVTGGSLTVLFWGKMAVS